MLDKLDKHGKHNVKIPTEQVLKKCEKLANCTSSGILATLLQDHCLIKDSEGHVMAKFPLTFKEFTKQLLLPDESHRYLSWIPLQFFYPFDIPVETRIIHVSDKLLYSGFCALNNLFGLACAGERGVGDVKKNITKEKLPHPIYFTNIEVPARYEVSDESDNPDDERECGYCYISKMKHVLRTELSCEVIKAVEDPSQGSSLLLSDCLIGFLASLWCTWVIVMATISL